MDETKPRLFVSIPMRGLDEFEVRAAQAAVKNYMDGVYETEFDLIDTYDVDEKPEGYVHDCYYLGESIKKLATADLCVFHPEWKNASGCLIEHMVCALYDIPYVELHSEQQDYIDEVDDDEEYEDE